MTAFKRVRSVRELSGLSLKKFCERHGLNFSTWSKIETGQSVLSQKSARRLIEAAKLEGILVDMDWLYEEKGEGPYKIDGLANPAHENFQDFAFHRMVANFVKFFPNAVTLTIGDDTCFPEYFEGDVVGGVRIDLSVLSMVQMREERFIVQLEDHSLALRLVDRVNGDGTLDLRTLNKYPSTCAHMEKNQPIRSIYALTFILRKSFMGL